MKIRKLLDHSKAGASYAMQLQLYLCRFGKNVEGILSPEDIELFRANDFYHDWTIKKETLQYVDEALPTLSLEICREKTESTTFVFSDVLVYEKKMKLGSNFVSHMEDVIDCFVGKKKKRVCFGILLSSGTWIYMEAKHLVLKSTTVSE